MNSLRTKYSILKISQGFTVLYAVLVAALLLSIGVSIYNISLKQYVLASSAIDSQIAIYAADGGIECALYWDIQNMDVLEVPGEVFGSPANDANNRTINCNDENVSTYTYRDSQSETGKVETTFISNFNGPVTTCLPNVPCLDLQCAEITVTKEFMTDGETVKTTIVSKGYNYCGFNPRKVERALRVSYPVDPNTGVPES